MNTKKMTKIITTLVFIGILVGSISMIYAAPALITDGINPSVSGLDNTLKRILYVIQVVCYFIAVVMLIVMGVKYIMASPEGKAELKKSSIQYIIGAALVFATGAVIQLVQSFATNTIKTS